MKEFKFSEGFFYVLIICLVFGLIIGGGIFETEIDRAWGNVCSVCEEGHLELFDIEKSRNGGRTYFYLCDNCGSLIDTNVQI